MYDSLFFITNNFG